MTDSFSRVDFGQANNIEDENDEMDALGSILSWDENEETDGDNDGANDLTNQPRVHVNMNDVQPQNGSNYMYNNAFLAKLKAQIAANSSSNASLSSPGVMQLQIPPCQQQHGNTEIQQQQVQQQPAQQVQQNQTQQNQQQQNQTSSQPTQQQQQAKKQHVRHQPQFSQNFIPNYVPQHGTSGNFQQQVFTAHLTQPTQNSPQIFTPASYGMVTHPNTQQQNEIRPNIYSQVQQQLNPDFIRSLQQQMSAQMQAHITQQNLQNQGQPHQQQAISIPPNLKVVTMNGVHASNIIGAQSTHMPIQTSISNVGPATTDSQINQAKKPLSSAMAKQGQSKQSRKKSVPNTKPGHQLSSRRTAQPVVSSSDTDNDVMSASQKRSNNELDSSPSNYLAEIDMNPEEKAKANRDRNREHARNTRLRKKAYLEKLKTTVDELCKERDALVSERSGKAHLVVEMHNTRTEVLLTFFSFRSSNEMRRQLWSSILDESCFQCVLPVTPYRSFPASEVQLSKSQRTILGIDGMISDTASLHVLLNSLVNRSLYPEGKIKFRYTLISEDAVVSGNQMMTRWAMTTLNAVENGARVEVSQRGMLCCKFSSAHTIVGLEIMFDAMAFMLQLKQSRGSESFAVIPNTIKTCQRPYAEPMVVTIADSPYTIVQVNHLWENMSEYRSKEVIGKSTPRILQGKETNPKHIEQIMEAVRYRRPCQVAILNYTKSGKKFVNYLSVYPLSTDSKITHFLGLSHHVKFLEKELKKTIVEQRQRESSVSATSATVSSISTKSSSTSMSSKASSYPLKQQVVPDFNTKNNI